MQMVAMRSLTSKSLSGLSLFIAILFLMGAVFAANNNTLTVKCVDESGKALAGAKVQIALLGTGAPAKWQDKKADGSGVAHYDKLDDGVYRVVARPEAFTPGLVDLVLLKNGAQETVTVKCPAGNPLKKFFFEDPAVTQKAIETLRGIGPLLQANKWEEAEKGCRSALELNPSSPDALYYLGVTLIYQKKWEATQEIWRQAAKMLNALVSIPQPKDAKGAVQPSP